MFNADSKYFNIQINIWKTAFNSKNPNNTTLGNFLSGKYFENFRFDMRNLVWIFKEHNNRAPLINPVYYNTIHKLINGFSIQQAVTNVREYVKLNGKDDVINAVKQLFPSTSVSAKFHNARRINAEKTITKLIAIDIDEMKDSNGNHYMNYQEREDWLNTVIAQLDQLQIAIWIDRSITGTGLYCIIPIDCDNEADVPYYYNGIKRLLESYNIGVDVLKDITRPRFWSDPSQAIINENVKPFTEKYIEPEEIQLYGNSKHNNINLGNTTEYDTLQYWQSCHKKGLKNAAANLNKAIGEFSELNTFLKYYFWAFNHYGLSLKYVQDQCWDYFKDHATIVNEKRYTEKRFKKDLANLYKVYKNQHHTFDFNLQRQRNTSTIKYDESHTIRYGSKLGGLKFPYLYEQKYILLDSPTNSGKTTSMVQYCFENNIKGLIVAPTQGAIEQIKNSFPKVNLFYEKEKSINENALVIATTYASLKKLINSCFNIYERFLIVDELHNVVLSTSKNFRNYELNFLMDNVLKFEKVMLMTGTFLKCHHPVLDHFYKVKIRYKNDTEKYLQIVYFEKENRFNNILDKIKQHSGLQIIYLDDKQMTKGLGKLLIFLKQNGYSDQDIQIINADQKNSEDYKNLIQNGRIKTNCKLIICTKIFVEALNLYDNVTAFHILSKMHAAYMQQLVTRPRLNQKCHVYLYWSTTVLENVDQTFWFDTEAYYNMLTNIAKAYIDTFDYSTWDKIHINNLNGSALVRKIHEEKILQPVNQNDILELDPINQVTYIVNTKYMIDYLSCDHLMYVKQMNNYHRNSQQLYDYLQQYNWYFLPEQNNTVVSIDKIDMSSIKKDKKDHDQLVFEFIINLITQGKDQNIKKLQSKTYEKINWKLSLRKRYAKLCEWFREDDANQLLKQITDNTRAYNILIHQTKIRQALLYGRSDIYDFANQIFAEFPLNSTWSSDEIFLKITNLIRINFEKVYKTSNVNTKTIAAQILNRYIETKKVRKQDPNSTSKKMQWVTKIISHHPIRRDDNQQAIEPLYT